MQNDVDGCVFSYHIRLNISINKTIINSLTTKEVISRFQTGPSQCNRQIVGDNSFHKQLKKYSSYIYQLENMRVLAVIITYRH